NLEWSFWQYSGVASCGEVPAASASDDTMWQFLDQTSPVSDNDDDEVAAFAPYAYQASAELGFPDGGAAYLAPYLMYTAADYAMAWPTPQPPTFDPSAMQDIDAWVQQQGSRLLFLYGEWDPWSGGKFRLGSATDSALFVQAQGTHGSDLAGLS